MRALMHTEVKLPTYIPTPIHDWILTQNVKPKEITTTTGIVLAQDQEREDLAMVLAVGDGYLTQNGYVPFKVKPGDLVRTTRKKGRTAYLDCIGTAGIGDTQTSYNYYQANEIIAVEYHSELMAERIRTIQAKMPNVISMQEELDYEAEVKEAARKKEEARQDKNLGKKKSFRDKMKEEILGE